MWKSIALVLVGLVGCVDGEEAPVAVTAPVAPPPARALVARQMPTLPSLPEAATSDPWAPDYVPEVSPEAYAHDEDYGDMPLKQFGEDCCPESLEPSDCPEGCGIEPEAPDEGLDERDFEANHDYEDEGADEREDAQRALDPDEREEPLAKDELTTEGSPDGLGCVGECHEGA